MDWGVSLSLLRWGIVGYGAAIFIIYLITMIIGVLIFQLLLRHQHEQVSFWQAFSVINLGQFLGLITPITGGAFIGKPLLAKFLAKLSLSKSISAIAFENFFGLAWQLASLPILLVILGEKIFLVNSVLKWALIFIVVLIFGYVAHQRHWFIPQLIKLKRLVPQRLRRLARSFGVTEKGIKETIDSLPEYLKQKPLLARLSFLVGVQALILPVQLYIALRYYDLHLGLFTIFALYWVSYILGRLSILPAGLGVKDVTLGGLLIGVGVASSTAIKVVLIFRFLTLIPPILIGAVLALIYAKDFKELIKEKKAMLSQ